MSERSPPPRRGPGMPCDPDSSAVPPPRDRSAMSARRDPRPTAHLIPRHSNRPHAPPPNQPPGTHRGLRPRHRGPTPTRRWATPTSSGATPGWPWRGTACAWIATSPRTPTRWGAWAWPRRCLCTERSRSATASRRRHRCWRQGCVSARGMRRGDGVRGAWTWRAGVSPVPATINAAQCTPLDAPARPPWTVPCQDAAAGGYTMTSPPARDVPRGAQLRSVRVVFSTGLSEQARAAALQGAGAKQGDSLRRLLKFVVARTGGRRMARTLSPRGRSWGLGDAVGWSILDVWVLRCA